MNNKQLLYKYAMFTWLGGIWFISSLPAQRLPQIDVLNFDKLAHVIVYLILGILIYKNFKLGLFGSLNKYELLNIAIILAALDEAHQVIIVNRTVSVFDLSANIAGLVIAYFIMSRKAG